jgi:hypothetical protein
MKGYSEQRETNPNHSCANCAHSYKDKQGELDCEQRHKEDIKIVPNGLCYGWVKGGELKTVKEVIAFLSALPQDYKICMSSDEEGNSFGTISTEVIQDKNLELIAIYPFRERLEMEEV